LIAYSSIRGIFEGNLRKGPAIHKRKKIAAGRMVESGWFIFDFWKCPGKSEEGSGNEPSNIMD
jgi:hypothetical protein